MSCDVNSNSQSAFNNHGPQVKEFLSKQISLSLIHQLQSLIVRGFFLESKFSFICLRILSNYLEKIQLGK